MMDVEIILIDDDEVTRLTWQLASDIKGVPLRTFHDPREFEQVIGTISKESKIYIDSMLADGLRGEDFAKTLFDRGYHNLYLATGHSKSHFPPMSWIREVVDKSPQF